ncbi:predicted protein [Naegleria gruberi]|uniref:Predicted protein n=1 Tax=Naegleria gruberi TaxID=5762 RepID=D2VJ09_NAEGR|nr:uncharacterized protein NAEGRDRAFT_34478 [Naegleria gruberi]EFC43119.1 predicted protein [Naegleria gruberi]|eukprot:XP_002675863.1 predicted protein [Naegleria gruberi strain NEG-M]
MAFKNKDSSFPSLGEFAGKVVYVSGGSAGIGYQTSLQFAREGARVVFTARNAHPDWYTGEEAEIKINRDDRVVASGGKATFIKCDISNYTQVRDLFFNKIDRLFGKLDIAVNNAGIGGPGGNLVDLDPEYFLGTKHNPMHNNAYGVVYQMHVQLQYWASKKDNSTVKSIVNLSSYNGLRACPGCSLYSASKHAIIGLTQSVAIEHAKATPKMPRVRVNAVAPGLIDTPLTRNQAKSIFEGIPTWQVLGKPEEMANVIMFLSSDRASYVSGTVISADNAETAK